MSRFENIEPKDIKVWVDSLTHRIVAKVWAGEEFHEVTFAEGTTNIQHIIDAIKEDLRESAAAQKEVE